MAPIKKQLRLFVYCRNCKTQLPKRRRSGFCSDACRRAKAAARPKAIVGRCTMCGKGLTDPDATICRGVCPKIARQRAYIQRWKQGLEDGMRAPGLLSNHIRKYLLDTRGQRCEECKWRRRNPITKLVPLHVHHIDGNPYNNVETNLVLLCPNCHSLKPNHGSLNTGQGRTIRRRQMLRDRNISSSNVAANVAQPESDTPSAAS